MDVGKRVYQLLWLSVFVVKVLDMADCTHSESLYPNQDRVSSAREGRVPLKDYTVKPL